jgi:hypothetical protein
MVNSMNDIVELRLAQQAREIRDLAPMLAVEKQKHDDALHEERGAEAALLDHVAAAAKPALPAIATRIEFFPSRWGVLLFDGWKAKGAPDIRGRRVYLLSDGSFAETWRTFEATEECSKGACATCSHVTATDVIRDSSGGFFIRFRSYNSALCIVKAHDPKPLISGLHGQMKSQRGKRVPCTVEAQKSTAKLNAILTLLG